MNRVRTIPRLLNIVLASPKLVEVEFENGQKFKLSSEFLRVQSPSADAKRRTASGEKIVAGRKHVSIMSIEEVGNYGFRISFDDLHNTGIYSKAYIYELGLNKFAVMREYLRSLQRLNLSRDPFRK